MPVGVTEYQHMLRGANRRWWRPVVALLAALAIAVPLMMLAFLPVVLAAAIAGVPDPAGWAGGELLKINNLGPAGFLYLNLTLIALIPASGLSIWLVHRVRPRYLSSVRGGIRWGWLLRCLTVVVPLWAVYLGVSIALGPEASARPAHWALLLVIVVLLTPLQAAGEEYLFRGWVMQNVGSWFRSPMLGLAVSLVVSVTTFAMAHGSPNVWVVGSLAVFALTTGLATWRTGGLEAAIAIHAVNNVGGFFIVILLGGWQDAFIGATTTSSPSVFLMAVAAHGLALALILWLAKRSRLEWRYQPPQPPVSSSVPPQLPASPVGAHWLPRQVNQDAHSDAAFSRERPADRSHG